METCRSELIQRSEQYGIVPKDLMMDSRISTTAKAVYAALATFGQTCFPSSETMAKGLGISKPTYYKALKELEAAGRVKVERKPRKVSVYHLK